MRKFLLLLVFLSPFQVLAQPVESIVSDMNNFTCPSGAEYRICGGNNAKLHNQFVSAMKKGSAIQAIQYWDQMAQTVDGSSQYSRENILPEPLFGTYQPEGAQLLPVNILAKKVYKGGIITVGNDCSSGCSLEDYYISFMRYKDNGMIYIYNQPLVPKGSTQYKTYSKLYSSDYPQFDIDITKGFQKGKFNNKDTNATYQGFLISIKDVSQKSIVRDYTISDNYRVKGGIVQHRSIMNGVGGESWKYVWSDTDIDASTLTLASPENGKDKFGSYYGGIRLKMNGENVFFTPIRSTSKLPSLYFQDGVTDSVYVMDYGYGQLHVLSGANASALIVLNNSYIYNYNKYNYDTYFSELKKVCNAHGDDTLLYDISAIDNKYCYGTFGSTPGNDIVKKTERIR